ncbi:MAG: hypothetical protein GF308_11390 [Candidatus Heimdallarchaeota archaeon]|nr:hypothetical protein [Candidatus Heimdallarchaeota archaeon]
MKNEEFIEKQISLFKEKRKDYQAYAELIKEILSKLLKQKNLYGIVQARAKTVASFTEKIFRKGHLYANPIEDMTDLCGARIILDSMADVQKVCRVIEENFIISIEDSEDKLERLGVSEFGYLSNHYIISLKKDNPFLVGFKIPEHFYHFLIEIQVRTLLQHAWAQVQHDTIYKGDFTVPKDLERKSYRIAAVLEDTDHDFQELINEMINFQENYGAYLSKEQLDKELEKMTIVYQADPTNLSSVIRYANLLRYIEDWDTMIEILSKVVDQNSSIVFRELGLALCKKYEPESEEYQKGINYLKKAITIDPQDSDAYCILGGRWKDKDPEKALDYYRKAAEIDPSNPYAVTNYLVLEIKRQKSLSFVSLLYSTITKTLEKCQNQIHHKINLPWAFFDIGLLYLLMGENEKAYESYLNGIRYSSESWMVLTTLETLALLNDVQDALPDLSSIEDLLTIGVIYKFHHQESREDFLSSPSLSIEPPVVIIAGSTRSSTEKGITIFQEKIIEAFSNFNGTVVSGGTTDGVCGIVGELQEKYPKNLVTIGFVPEKLPDGAKIDTRYSKINKIKGSNFSPKQVIAYWKAILLNSIEPAKVHLIGYSGGNISGFEYRFALLLGAKVGLIEESGRMARKVLKNEDWNTSLMNGKKDSMLSQVVSLTNSEKEIKDFIEK